MSGDRRDLTERDDAELFQRHRKQQRVRRAVKHGAYSGLGFFLLQLTFREFTDSPTSLRFMIVMALIGFLLVGVLSGLAEYAFAPKEEE